MLKQMLDDASVGYYALGVSLSATWAFVLAAIIDSLYQAIIQLHGKDRAAYERKNRQLYAVVFYVSVGVSAPICVLAEPIVGVLYGQECLPAVAPPRIIVWYTAFSYLGVARNAWVVCEGGQRWLKYLYASAALINVALNALLIPALGPSGAALASLAMRVSTTMALPFLIRPLRPNAILMLDAILLRGVLPAGRG